MVSTALAAVGQVLADLTTTVLKAVVEPAAPLAHTLVHALVAWRAASVLDHGMSEDGGRGGRRGDVIGPDVDRSVVRLGLGAG